MNTDHKYAKNFSIDEIQRIIRDFHRIDGDGRDYYEKNYMTQEQFYWRPVPAWIDQIEPVHAVLDVGAAYGTLLTYVILNKKPFAAYAIDPVGYMSRTLIEKLDINFVRIDFEREYFDAHTKFDLILFTEVIEHLNFHPLPTLLKLKSLLNPKGRLIITTPDAQEWGRITTYYPTLDAIPEYDGRQSKWIDAHIWQYTKEELDDLFNKAGFAIEQFDYSPGVTARHLCYMLKLHESTRDHAKGSPMKNTNLTQLLNSNDVIEAIYTTDERIFLHWAYILLLGRKPDDQGLSTYLSLLKHGEDRLDILDRLYRSNEFRELNNLSSTLSDENFLRLAYRKLLLREPDTAGFELYLAMLRSRQKSREDLIRDITYSDEAKNSSLLRARSALLPIVAAYAKLKNNPLKRMFLQHRVFRTEVYTTSFLSMLARRLDAIDRNLAETIHITHPLPHKTAITPEIENIKDQSTPPSSFHETSARVSSTTAVDLVPSFAHTDICWNTFYSSVLSNRHRYRGVFVQEIVIDWNVPLYQRPQHMAVAMARLGYLVIYRTPNWGQDNVNGFREIYSNVWLTNSEKVDEIKNAIHSVYSTAYYHDPETLAKRDIKIIYEYIDHIDEEISGNQETIQRLVALQKFAFNGGATYVIASARQLYEEAVAACGKSRVLLLPNGVDTAHYRNPKHATTPIPDHIKTFCARHKNIVGYFGAIAPWLWYEVIEELVKSRLDLGFLFIGPDYFGGVEKLPKASNFMRLDAVDYSILPAYARVFDVCLIPFKPGRIAQTTSPLKLFEYFAMEKPVVVTSDMAECTQYKEVISGGSAQSLSMAIDRALSLKDDLDFRRRLGELANHNDWFQRALTLDKFLNN